MKGTLVAGLRSASPGLGSCDPANLPIQLLGPRHRSPPLALRPGRPAWAHALSLLSWLAAAGANALTNYLCIVLGIIGVYCTFASSALSRSHAT